MAPPARELRRRSVGEEDASRAHLASTTRHGQRGVPGAVPSIHVRLVRQQEGHKAAVSGRRRFCERQMPVLILVVDRVHAVQGNEPLDRGDGLAHAALRNRIVQFINRRRDVPHRPRGQAVLGSGLNGLLCDHLLRLRFRVLCGLGKQSRKLIVALIPRAVQRTEPLIIRDQRVGAVPQQQPDHAGMALHRGHVHR